MNIKKPELPPQLFPVESLREMIAEAKQEEADLTGMLIRDATIDGEDLGKIYFRNSRFENCRFLGCSFDKGGFLDVEMKQCDLSNSSFSDSYFHRCRISSCKWMGTDLQNSTFKHMFVSGCNFQMSNFDHSVFDTVSFSDCNLNHANLSSCKWKHLEFTHANLDLAMFFKTPMKGLNLTTNTIDGISVSDSFMELRGAVVSPTQAAELSKLLGLVIK